MASKKSTPKLKKTKNKNSEHEDLETSSTQKDISTENEAMVVDEIARRAEPTTENRHSSATLAPDAPLPRIPEKAKDMDKKKSKFWSFVKRKKMFLPRCSEVKEEPDEEGEMQNDRKPRCTGHNIAGILYRASLHSNDASASPVPTSASQARRLSMGAGSGPTGLSATISPVRMQLLQLVPPANSTLLDLPEFAQQGTSSRDEANDVMLCQQMRATDMGVVISSNPIGYPHLCFSRSMSNSSSGSSSSSGASSVTDHSVTHGLVSTIYPQIDVIVPNARFHGPPHHPLTTNTSTFLPKLPGSEQVIDNSHLGAVSNCSSLSHTVHTQVDYVHYLVPDLLQLTNCSFYWGVMDRYEAERLLENRPEGTFLVRDSAQEEFLFSVSFRRYGRSLHARIEQLNHRFSFDSHDLGVFASSTVCGLIEHYKDPNCCMFFEPMLTLPLCRTFCFSLQHLCRAVICSHVNYDSINELQLPKCLHEYLKYYHYKLRICVRKFETH